MFPCHPELIPALQERLMILLQRLNGVMQFHKEGDGPWQIVVLSANDILSVHAWTLDWAVDEIERETAHWQGELLPGPSEMAVWFGLHHAIGDGDHGFIPLSLTHMPMWYWRMYASTNTN